MKNLILCLAAVLASVCSMAQSKFNLEGNQLLLPSPITFQTGSDVLSPSSESALQHIADYLTEKTYISTLRIEVHSDNQGSAEANQNLTEKRSLSVGRWLVSHGIDCGRLICVGFGDTKPLASNASPEGRMQNRRVTVVNAALRQRAIGGMPIDGGGKVAGDLCTK